MARSAALRALHEPAGYRQRAHGESGLASRTAPTNANRGINTPRMPSHGRLFRSAITTRQPLIAMVTEIAVASLAWSAGASSAPNGSAPSSRISISVAPRMTASTDTRPFSAQYTSSRCKISANSSSTSAAPTPNEAPIISHHGEFQPAGAKASTPLTSMKTMPKTT